MKILIIFAFIAHTLAALGTTVGTPASMVTRGLKTAIEKYLANGGDINALSMNDVLKMVDVDKANSTSQGKFEDRFEILGGRGPVDPATMAKMIAYTAYRIAEDRRDGPGRYVIWLADGDVNYNWESEEKVTALLSNAGMKLIDRGAWNQPDTKAQSMFHVGTNPKPPIDDNRTQEDEAGRRLSIPTVKTQNDQRQSEVQHPGTTSEPNTTPVLKLAPTPKESVPKTATASDDLPSSTPWSIVILLIVTTTGLLWLLVKKRK